MRGIATATLVERESGSEAQSRSAVQQPKGFKGSTIFNDIDPCAPLYAPDPPSTTPYSFVLTGTADGLRNPEVNDGAASTIRVPFGNLNATRATAS